MNPEIEGLEFDWFAVDSSGNHALFATAGEGFVPPVVAARFREHHAISDAIPSPRVGTLNVWDDFADLGLYVYDWNLPGGPYVRMRVPTTEITGEVKRMLSALSSLPSLNLEFKSCESIAAFQVGSAESE